MGYFKSLVLILLSLATAPLFAKDSSNSTTMPCQYLLQSSSIDVQPPRQARSRRLHPDIDSQDPYSGNSGMAEDASRQIDARDPGEF